MISDELHLEQVSHVLNIPMQLLRDMNPQYKKDIIPGKEKPYALRIPLEYSMQFIEYGDSIFAYHDSVYFNKENISKSPPGYTATTYSPAPPSPNMAKLYYTVKSGDNLGFISEWYHVGLSELKYWNNIYGTVIRVGQKLVIYVPNSQLDQYQDINSMSFEEKQKMIGKEVKIPENFNLQTTGQDTGEYIYYLVKP
jgi:membrane-bound lytic murein transglycosylase D